MKHRAIILFLMAVPGIACLVLWLLNGMIYGFSAYGLPWQYMTVLVGPAFLDVFAGIRALGRGEEIERSTFDVVLIGICALLFILLLWLYAFVLCVLFCNLCGIK